MILRLEPGRHELFDFKSLAIPCEELDACDHDARLGAGDGGLAVFGETAVATEPGKGALEPNAGAGP